MFLDHLYFCIFITLFTPKFKTLCSYGVAFTCESLHSQLVTIHELYLSIICDIVVCVVGEFNRWQI